jgi:hypothetical protein
MPRRRTHPDKQNPAPRPPVSSNVTLFTQVGSTNETQTTGGTVFPPDGDIATSSQWMVQVNNDVVVMYNWNTNAFVSKKFSTFFQDSTNFIFDPRVIYDPYWNRFVVMGRRLQPVQRSDHVELFRDGRQPDQRPDRRVLDLQPSLLRHEHRRLRRLSANGHGPQFDHLDL